MERIEYHLPENDQVCTVCSGPLHAMSAEVRRELQVIPAQVKVIEHVQAVYACRHCERDALTTPIRKARARQERSRPVLTDFAAWLQEQTSAILPKSALGEAVTYCRNQWTALEAFLGDGRLEIDNNRAERAIKPFVMGRKAWLFVSVK